MADSRVVVTAASVFASAAGQIVYDYMAGAVTMGSKITQGQPVFLTSDNTWKQIVAVDPPVSSTFNSLYGLAPGQTRGFALNAAYPGQPLSVCIADTDFTTGATIVKGTTYMNYNAGGFIDFATLDNRVRVIIGIAKSTTNMSLNFSSTGAAG